MLIEQQASRHGQASPTCERRGRKSLSLSLTKQVRHRKEEAQTLKSLLAFRTAPGLIRKPKAAQQLQFRMLSRSAAVLALAAAALPVARAQREVPAGRGLVSGLRIDFNNRINDDLNNLGAPYPAPRADPTPPPSPRPSPLGRLPARVCAVTPPSASPGGYPGGFKVGCTVRLPGLGIVRSFPHGCSCRNRLKRSAMFLIGTTHLCLRTAIFAGLAAGASSRRTMIWLASLLSSASKALGSCSMAVRPTIIPTSIWW